MPKVTKKAPSKKKVSKKKPAKKTPKKKVVGAAVEATVSTSKGSKTETKQVAGPKGFVPVTDVFGVLGFNLGHTKNIGDHEFVKASISVDMPINQDGEFLIPLEMLKEPLHTLKDWCDDQMGEWIEEIDAGIEGASEEEGDPLEDIIGDEEEEEEEEDEFDLEGDEEEEEELDLELDEEEEEYEEEEGDEEEEEEEALIGDDDDDDPLGLGEL